ncbi:Rsa3 domain-containing protein [Mycena indigotica]|uniref:Ribosome assembly protein 3 n=1 Tax=Mycena indigotica TaxID=2126181 RepID=A0A8H6SLE5_9AGAR|nr:Rsa3 domain-containing protein [Mycena indigotica]KAF7300967.1 Rsa3 domain-containing protein [Mycena indigotica]
MPPAPRKRTRKRKRRALSVSSSSSSSSSDSDAPATAKALPEPKAAIPLPSDDSSSSESSSSSSDSDSEPEQNLESITANTSGKSAPPAARPPPNRRDSPSPPPPSPTLPSFLPPKDAAEFENTEQEMKEKFRKFWMASVADGFKEDLEQIRVKEPNLGQSRLAMLIDSLASGADVFSSTTQRDGVNEMQVVLD